MDIMRSIHRRRLVGKLITAFWMSLDVYIKDIRNHDRSDFSLQRLDLVQELGDLIIDVEKGPFPWT